jgi:hypothetical protein
MLSTQASNSAQLGKREKRMIEEDIKALESMRKRILKTEASPRTKRWLDDAYKGLGEVITALEIFQDESEKSNVGDWTELDDRLTR